MEVLSASWSALLEFVYSALEVIVALHTIFLLYHIIGSFW